MEQTQTTRKSVTDDESTQEEQVTEQVTEQSVQDYSKMTVASLKKLLENRKIEGRSKLTTKGVIVKVLELFDQDPQDKTAISALVAELSTPRKKKSDTEKTESSSSDVEEKKPKKSSKKDKKTDSEIEENPKKEQKPKEQKPKEQKPKEQKPKEQKTKKTASKKETKTSQSKKEDEEDWLEKEGIYREDYPPGTRFVKSKTGKITVRYPKDSKTEASESEKSSEEKKNFKKSKKTELEESDNVSLVGEEIKKDESSPSFLRYSEMNVENDPAMQEMLDLTRDVLRRMRSMANEARDNENLKKSWINDLKVLKERFDHELGILAVTVDEN